MYQIQFVFWRTRLRRERERERGDFSPSAKVTDTQNSLIWPKPRAQLCMFFFQGEKGFTVRYTLCIGGGNLHVTAHYVQFYSRAPNTRLKSVCHGSEISAGKCTKQAKLEGFRGRQAGYVHRQIIPLSLECLFAPEAETRRPRKREREEIKAATLCHSGAKMTAAFSRPPLFCRFRVRLLVSNGLPPGL